MGSDGTGNRRNLSATRRASPVTSVLDGKTILFVHASDELYGADRCLLDLVHGLPTSTRAVVALPLDLPYDGALSRELIDAGAEVRRIDFAVLRRSNLNAAHWPMLGRRLILGTWRLATVALDCRADIVHTNTLAAVSGPIAAALTRRRHVWQVHEMIGDERWPVRLVYRLLLLLPGRVIANSRATARALAGPVTAVRHKATVVYPGIHVGDHALQREDDGDPNGALRVAFVGRLAPRKGIETLLVAVALLRELGIDLRLDIFGSAAPQQEWREGQYRRRTQGLGLSEIVRFHGFVTDIDARLEHIDVLVVPSQRPEPFGLVVLEGMAAGCAVVVSRNGGGSDEILEHGVTGLYCGKEASSIAAAIKRLADDPALRERIGQQARHVVRTRFGTERYRDGVLGVYRRLLD